MGFAQQLEKLSGQPMEEQNLLVKSYKDLKDYLHEKKVDKFMKDVNKLGSSELEISSLRNDRDVIIKVIQNEAQFRSDMYMVNEFEAEFEKPFKSERGAVETKEWFDKYEIVQGIYDRVASYGNKRKAEPVLLYAPDEITESDLQIGRMAVQLLDGNETKFLGPKLLDDKEIAITAITNYWNNGQVTLERFSERLKNDKDCVLEIVKHDGVNLEFASDRLKDDIDVARASHKNWSDDGIPFISNRLKNDKSFGAEIAGSNGYKLQYFGDEIKDDIHIVRKAISSSDSQVINDASPRLQAIGGSTSPKENLQKAIEQEKFSHSLDKKLAPKVEASTRKMKI